MTFLDIFSKIRPALEEAHGKSLPPTGKDGWIGAIKSPLRPDNSPSFTIKPDTPEDPVGAWTDKATGETGSLISLAEMLGYTIGQGGNGGGVERDDSFIEYVYCDESGNKLYRALRYGYGRKKRFTQGAFVNGNWTNKMNGHIKKDELVPYELPTLLHAIKNKTPVWIVEGERDVETMIREGYVATCFIGGANQWYDHYAKYFAKADVIICPDRDAPGIEYASKIENGLRGVADRVRVVDLPYPKEENHGKDVTDFFRDGHTREELERLLDASWKIDGVATLTEIIDSTEEAPELHSLGMVGLGMNWGITGVGPGVFLVISARLGVGKTAWMVDLMARAILSGKRVYISTMDEPAARMARYIITSISGDGRYALPPVGDLKKLVIHPKEWSHKYQNVVLDEKSRTPEQLMDQISRYRPDIAFVDHLASMAKADPRQRTWDKIEEAAYKLKDAARWFGTCVVAASQMNRSGDDSGAAPSVSHLYGSDAIGQCADIILAIQKPSEDDATSFIRSAGTRLIGPPDQVRKIYVLKSRFGMAGNNRYVTLAGMERRYFDLHNYSCTCPSCQSFDETLAIRTSVGLDDSWTE